jgi:hypothetical protein
MERVWRTQEEIGEIVRRQIMTLPPQTLFYKRRGELKTYRVHVMDVPDLEDHPYADFIPKARAKLLGAVRGRFGREKHPVQVETEDDSGY